MYKLKSVQENEKEILWDFEIQTDLLKPATRSDLVIKKRKKRTHPIMVFLE